MPVSSRSVAPTDAVDLRPSGAVGERRESRRWRAGAGPLALIAAVPFAVLLIRVVAVRAHVFLSDDSAVVSVAVRRALSWQQQLGIYDRFGWHHPGPSYFYLVATVERVLGRSYGAQSQMAAVILVNGACVVGSVVLIGRHRGRAAAAGAAAALSAVAALMGDTGLDSVWTTFLVIFPLILAGVLAAVAVTGSPLALLGVFVVGSFAVQTDVATAPLAALFAAAGIAGCLRRLVRVGWRRPPWPTLAGAAVLGAVLCLQWVPPLVEQFTSSPGNLTLLWRFFTHPHATLGLLNGAVQVGNNSVAALGIRSTAIQLARQPGLWQLGLVSAGGLAVLAGALWARNRLAVILAALGVGGLAVALYAASSIVGIPFAYLMTWSSAPVALSLTAAGVLVGEGLTRVRRRELILGALVVASTTALVVRVSTLPSITARSSAPVAETWQLVRPVVAARPHQQVGLVATGYASGDVVGGLADELDERHIPFSSLGPQGLALAPGHGAPPRYWIEVSEGTTPPPGFRVVGRASGLTVSLGETAPAGS